MACVGLALLVASLTSPSARGEGGEASLMEKGIQLRREHRDAEALAIFRRAHSANPTPRALAQIALAEQALGQWVEAERDLRTALNAVDDDWIANHRAALTEELDTLGNHLGTLTVKANSATGVVSLNGVKVGELPLTSVRVPSGSLRIEVVSPGYHPAVRIIQVGAGAVVSEELRLTELEKSPPPAALEPDSGAAGREAGAPALHHTPEITPRPAAGSSADEMRRVFAWGSLGTAGIFLGGAIAAQVVGADRATKYNDDAQCMYGDLSRDERCGVYRGQAETAQTVATVGFVAAGAFGLGAAILFLLKPGGTKTTGVEPWLQVGAGASVGIHGKL